MPTPEQLYAMNMSEAEALGKIVVIQMDELEDAADKGKVDFIFEQRFEGTTIALNPNEIRFSQS